MGTRPARSGGDRGPRAHRSVDAGGPVVPRPDAVSYAERALRGDPQKIAVVSVSQSREDVVLDLGELRDQVGRASAGLRRLGVGRGDRVVAYLPNIAETIVAFLATASLGAVWASCAPEFGTASVVARFQQIEPKVLLAVDGYRYGAKGIDRRVEVAELRRRCPAWRPPSWSRTSTPTPGSTAPRRGTSCSRRLLRSSSSRCRSTTRSTSSTPRAPPGCPSRSCTATAASSSSTRKALALHKDIGPDDRFFWFSTTGWMMWNFLVSGLVVGARIVLLRRRPRLPRPRRPVGHGRRAGRHQLRHQRPVPHGVPQGGPHPGRRPRPVGAAQRRLDRRAAARRAGSSGSTRR